MNQKYTIGFYNLENLFDIENTPNIRDSDFTPEGKKKWNLDKYQRKIEKLGFAISQIGLRETESIPSILGISEVENMKVIQDLISTDNLENHNLGIIHYDSLDERGIDNALIYQKKCFTPLEHKPLRFVLENDNGTQDFTRDVLYVNGKLGNELIHVFVLHLPSKRQNDVNKSKRNFILQKVYEEVQQIFERESTPHIIVMGDFNENPDSQDLKRIFHAKADSDSVTPQGFYNPMENLSKVKGSLQHNNKWLLFDQILFSKSFLYETPTLSIAKVDVFDERFLQNWHPKYNGEPYRTFVGRRYKNGYSDHFPVYAILNHKS